MSAKINYKKSMTFFPFALEAFPNEIYSGEKARDFRILDFFLFGVRILQVEVRRVVFAQQTFSRGLALYLSKRLLFSLGK